MIQTTMTNNQVDNHETATSSNIVATWGSLNVVAYEKPPQEVEMISGNNGRNVQGLLSGSDGRRGGEGFENSRELTAKINEYGLDMVIGMSAEANDLSDEEIDILREFAKDIEAGNDAAGNDKTDQVALLIDSDGLIAQVTSHAEIAGQIDGTSARDLGGSPDTNTVDGEEVEVDGQKYAIKSNQFWSPLVFDFDADGIDTTAATDRTDINADGRVDAVNSVGADDGILVIDADGDGVAGEDGSEYFGNFTDLSDLGIEGQFANGFEALRALAEKEGLVGKGDQVLDEADIEYLENKYQLGFKVGGYNADVSAASELVSEITLGQAGETERDYNFDGRGNMLESQAGTSFVTADGEESDYADLWHRAG